MNLEILPICVEVAGLEWLVVHRDFGPGAKTLTPDRPARGQRWGGSTDGCDKAQCKYPGCPSEAECVKRELHCLQVRPFSCRWLIVILVTQSWVTSSTGARAWPVALIRCVIS